MLKIWFILTFFSSVLIAKQEELADCKAYLSDPPAIHLSVGVQSLVNEGRLNENLIFELFQNRVSQAIPEIFNNEDTGRHWFLSTANNGDRYKVSLYIDQIPPKVTYVGRTSAAMERLYFKIQGRDQISEEHPLKRTIRGARALIVDPSIKIKVKEKHGLTIEEILESIENYNGKVFDSPKYQNQFDEPTFYIIGKIGSREIKSFFKKLDPFTLVLVTAFER